MLPVVIICGGLGTRIKQISKGQPKSLIEILDKPFLYWQLDNLIAQDVKKVILCVGHLADQVEAAIKIYDRKELEIIISDDGNELLGTGGAVKKASKIAGDTFFVMYGDSFLTCSFKAVQEYFFKMQSDVLLTVYKNDNRFDISNIAYKDGEIVDYEKNPVSPMSYIDYGLGLYSYSVFEKITGSSFDLSFVIKKLLAESKLNGFEVFERFYEIGSVKGIRDLEDFLSRSL